MTSNLHLKLFGNLAFDTEHLFCKIETETMLPAAGTVALAKYEHHNVVAFDGLMLVAQVSGPDRTPDDIQRDHLTVIQVAGQRVGFDCSVTSRTQAELLAVAALVAQNWHHAEQTDLPDMIERAKFDFEAIAVAPLPAAEPLLDTEPQPEAEVALYPNQAAAEAAGVNTTPADVTPEVSPAADPHSENAREFFRLDERADVVAVDDAAAELAPNQWVSDDAEPAPAAAPVEVETESPTQAELRAATIEPLPQAELTAPDNAARTAVLTLNAALEQAGVVIDFDQASGENIINVKGFHASLNWREMHRLASEYFRAANVLCLQTGAGTNDFTFTVGSESYRVVYDKVVTLTRVVYEEAAPIFVAMYHGMAQ